MGYESGSPSQDGRDEDDEEEYEEAGGGNRFLGFMFGNVDNSGDLDVDYLDEDAKEHLAALADKLGPSLTDIDLSVKSPRTPADAAEQDYDEKAEDAVDYEDIDEQYEGPEIQATTEEDHWLPKKEYFSAEVSLAALKPTSIFDDENYDEELELEHEIVDNNVQIQTISGELGESSVVVSKGEKSLDGDLQVGSPEVENVVVEVEEDQEVPQGQERSLDEKDSTPLPVLCMENGKVILRFSEIFGIHKPLKKVEKRDHRYSIPKDRFKYMDISDIVEEDEEAFLKDAGQGYSFLKQAHGIEHGLSAPHDDGPEVATFGVLQGAASLTSEIMSKFLMLYILRALWSLTCRFSAKNLVIFIDQKLCGTHMTIRAQKLPSENKSLRPPGAFKKKSELSAKDGHVFLMEYCEERPLLLGNIGMGARLCTYYQKCAPDDQTGSMLRNGNSSLGHVIVLDPADKSPFLGDIKPGCNQSSVETNIYRAPIFPHKVPSTDYLLVRSAKGKLSIRRIDKIDVVGQQEPLMEVISPGSKALQNYMTNRLLVHMAREFRTAEKRHLSPRIRADELPGQFPYLSEIIIRKKLKEHANLQRGPNGQWIWVKKRNFRIWSEDELREKVKPEDVCAYESMQAGIYHLKHLGISGVLPTSISSAMSRLPDEAIILAAASHIERELQITPWNLSSNFFNCVIQGKENIERLEITGVGDPSGRGLGFSYVRTTPKAPMSSAMMKKKAATGRGGPTVTGTDADLRRLSMEAAREVLLKFDVGEEEIAKLTRWHRIAMIRKLSSEQAASGVQIDPTTISKYARGQRMSFLQLQQQTREKCQEIWDRQVQSLSALDHENESDEGNSDLDSFAGDLENLLDAEECEEVGNYDTKYEKADGADGVKGLKMRRRPSLAQAEEEIEDEAAEAAELCRLLWMVDDDAERRKKKKTGVVREQSQLAGGSQPSFGIENVDRIKQIIGNAQPGGSYTSKEYFSKDKKEVENVLAKRSKYGKVKATKKPDITNIGLLGHMRTNKNCPKYGEDPEANLETADLEKASIKSKSLDPSSQSQQKPQTKKLIPKSATKIAIVEAPDGEKSSLKAKVLPVKFKCGSIDKLSDNLGVEAAPGLDQPVTSISETGKSIVKFNKIIIPSKMKADDADPPKPSIVIRPPTNTAKDQPESHRRSLVIRPQTETDRDQPQKKIIIKRPKEIMDVDQVSQDGSTGFEYRKTKRIVELSKIEKHRKQENMFLAGESAKKKAREDRRWWEEQEKQRNEERLKEERTRRLYEGEMRMLEEQEKLAEIKRYEASIRREREEEERQKAKQKKKKRPEVKEEYLEDPRTRRSDKRMPERDRSAKRRPVVELGRYSAEYTPQTKRRKGGEVLHSIIPCLLLSRFFLHLVLFITSYSDHFLYGIISHLLDKKRLEHNNCKDNPVQLSVDGIYEGLPNPNGVSLDANRSGLWVGWPYPYCL
ncbi:Transcription initiation factor TFIID subunit 1 [Morella rubra]|uniref:Transcription initiation factor TFIID subunit 1 n=1 Tax=Morella rubra TaxID=262757 RepID=A0A6A1VXU1_9ROSI|nr:Transcription initiation factor TFIID subunit 1 [Morella rubra]